LRSGACGRFIIRGNWRQVGQGRPGKHKDSTATGGAPEGLVTLCTCSVQIMAVQATQHVVLNLRLNASRLTRDQFAVSAKHGQPCLEAWRVESRVSIHWKYLILRLSSTCPWRSTRWNAAGNPFLTIKGQAAKGWQLLRDFKSSRLVSRRDHGISVVDESNRDC